MTNFPMTDEHVRRRLFWLIQRLSSYTLWQRKRNVWALFADKYEEALKTWPEEKTRGFHPKGIIYIYDALRLFDEGLAELATGNRQVWQRKTGAFHQLARPVDLVGSFLYGPCHERGMQFEHYPDFIESLNKLRLAAEYWGDNLLYPPYNNVCNTFDAGYLLDSKNYSSTFAVYPYPVFPKNLPSVPDGTEIIIKTGEPVPCDGIWEPVKLTHNHKFLVFPTAISAFKTLGAFNYFIRGMNAPLQVYEDMLRADGWGYREVQWRLVWEDTRYCDGIIPDESAYFLNEAQGKRIQCRTGEQCPHSGQWATLAGGHQQFTYARAGQKMPEAEVFKGGFGPATFTQANWSLLDRDDDGSVFVVSPDETH